ncbi:hypothetical protein [Clostridium saccharoperbutylacetonicum]
MTRMKINIFGILAITFLFLGVVESSVSPANGIIRLQEIAVNG